MVGKTISGRNESIPTVSVEIADSFNLDASSRIRASNPTSLFDNQLLRDNGPMVWTTDTTGSATITYSSNENSAYLNLTTASGDEAIRQTKRYFRYQPGKSQTIMMSFIFGSSQDGLRQRIGYFDALDGIFLEREDSTLKIIRRSSVTGSAVDDSISQDSWNIDKFDGNGPSGVTLDFEKTQILIIDLQWLGGGRVRVGFNVDGIVRYAHQFISANNISVPYMGSACLPCRAEIKNLDAVITSPRLIQICVSVSSEGGYNPQSLKFCANRGDDMKCLDNSTEPLITIRRKSGNLSTEVTPTNISVLVTSNDSILVEVYMNADITGGESPSWVSADTTSDVEYDISADDISGGVKIFSAYVSNRTRNILLSDIFDCIKLGSELNGTEDTVTVSATPVDGDDDIEVAAAINWKEVQ